MLKTNMLCQPLGFDHIVVSIRCARMSVCGRRTWHELRGKHTVIQAASMRRPSSSRQMRGAMHHVVIEIKYGRDIFRALAANYSLRAGCMQPPLLGLLWYLYIVCATWNFVSECLLCAMRDLEFHPPPTDPYASTGHAHLEEDDPFLPVLLPWDDNFFARVKGFCSGTGSLFGYRIFIRDGSTGCHPSRARRRGISTPTRGRC